MDRDLGATTTIPDILTTCGLGYQWGRKDPLLGLLPLEVLKMLLSMIYEDLI